MSLTGCVVLVGIAVNDAILKVDFINSRRSEGLPLETAIRQAGHDRFRPIVMTTLTTVLGLLPLALRPGPGGSLQSPMAWSLLGGLLVATTLTLILLPTLSSIVLPPTATSRPSPHRNGRSRSDAAITT